MTYVKKLDCSELFNEWEHDKHEDILTYRDKCFVSRLSGKKAVKFHTTWVNAFDDSLQCFVDGPKVEK